MTFDSLEQIIAFIEQPKNEEMLVRANQIRKKHELHVSGIGLDEYIDKIQGVENEDAVSLRRALGKVITQPESNKIITVENKIFTARGGGRLYDFSNDKDKEFFRSQILTNVKSGISLHTYMRKVWKELVNIDPSGLLLAEINKDQEVFITYKSSESIYDIGFTSATNIEYIIFKPEIVKEKDTSGKSHDVKIYRVIDDSFDYLIWNRGTEFRIIEEQTFTNPWGYVPGSFISDRRDKKSRAYTTHIEEAMIYADDMLLDYTIYKIYKVKQGIPYHWQYEIACKTCEGSGQIDYKDSTQLCTVCNGSGVTNNNRDIADILILPIPEDGDVPLTPPAGFVQGDLQTWKQFEETIDSEALKMYAAVWGELSFVDKERKNVTASEVIIRENSKESKLNEISDNEENVETKLTNIFGNFYFPNTYQGAIINNGRNFNIKTSTELLDEYKGGLESGISSTQLTEILEAYYFSLYNRSPQKLNESIIKLKTKPFFHWQPDKLQQANVNEIDYLKNLYFDEFVVWYEQEKEKLGTSTLADVQKEFDKWIVKKELKKEISNTNLKEE